MVPDDTQGGSAVITLVGTMTVKSEHEEEFVAYATSTVETVLQKEPGTILALLSDP